MNSTLHPFAARGAAAETARPTRESPPSRSDRQLAALRREDRRALAGTDERRGRIVERGTHADLLANGGEYAALWRRQSGGFLAEAP